MREMLNDIEIADYLGCSRSTVWRYHKNGLLPPVIKLGRGLSRWSKTDLENHHPIFKNLSSYLKV